MYTAFRPGTSKTQSLAICCTNTENRNIYLFIVQVKYKCTKTNIVLSKALDQSHETEVEWFSFTNSQARGILFECLRNNPTANCKLNVCKSFY